MGCSASVHESTANEPPAEKRGADKQQPSPNEPPANNSSPAAAQQPNSENPPARAATPTAATGNHQQAADTPSSSEGGGKAGVTKLPPTASPQSTQAAPSTPASPGGRSTPPVKAGAPPTTSPAAVPITPSHHHAPPAPPPAPALAGGMQVMEVTDGTGRKVKSTLASRSKVDTVVNWIESNLYTPVQPTQPPVTERSTTLDTASLQSWHTMPHNMTHAANHGTGHGAIQRKTDFPDPQLQAATLRTAIRPAPPPAAAAAGSTDNASQFSTSRYPVGVSLSQSTNRHVLQSASGQNSAAATPQPAAMEASTDQPSAQRSTDLAPSNSSGTAHPLGGEVTVLPGASPQTRHHAAPPPVTPMHSSIAPLNGATPQPQYLAQFPSDGVVVAEGGPRHPSQQNLVQAQCDTAGGRGGGDQILPYSRHRAAAAAPAGQDDTSMQRGLTASLAMHGASVNHHNFGDKASQSMASSVGGQVRVVGMSPSASRSFPEPGMRAVSPQRNLTSVATPHDDSIHRAEGGNSPQASSSRPKPPDAAESGVFTSGDVLSPLGGSVEPSAVRQRSSVPAESPRPPLERDQTAEPGYIGDVLDGKAAATAK